MITVEFYGVLQQAAGSERVQYPLELPAPVERVLEGLQLEYPQLAAHLPRLACAVNDEIVPRSEPIAPGATLALLPPVSGG